MLLIDEFPLSKLGPRVIARLDCQMALLNLILFNLPLKNQTLENQGSADHFSVPQSGMAITKSTIG